jgi:hypothetical protein
MHRVKEKSRKKTWQEGIFIAWRSQCSALPDLKAVGMKWISAYPNNYKKASLD